MKNTWLFNFVLVLSYFLRERADTKISTFDYSELLKSTITKNMSKFINITCRMHSDRTNCIIAGSLLVNSGEYTVCSTCRGALALCAEFKCNNSNCKSSVFIDGKGNPKNEFCNECAQNSNR